MSGTRPITFHVPEDSELLRAIGVVSVRHGHLDHVLRMTIKSLTNVSPDEAVFATAHCSSSELRKRVRAVARQVLGEGRTFVRLEALLERCRLASERRNDLIHALFGREIDGEIRIRDRNHEWRAPPTVAELNDLAEKLGAVTLELNAARMEGFLLEELVRKGIVKPPT